MYWPSPGWAWPAPWTVSSWAVGAACVVIRQLLVDEVDDGEDDDPHHVDEVPVQTDDLDGLRTLGRQLSAQRHHVEADQHEDAYRHVHTVETGERVEGRALQVGRVAETLPVEGRELVD